MCLRLVRGRLYLAKVHVAGSTLVARAGEERCCCSDAVVFGLVLLGLALAAGCGGGKPQPEPSRPPTAVGRIWNTGRHALGVALRRPEDVVEPAPEGVRGRPWVYCEQALRSRGIDLEAENRAVERFLATLEPGHAGRYDAIIVPGYTPLDATAPLLEIHPIAVERLELARQELAAGTAPVVIVSGGNVHPPDTPVNEALQMKQWLLAHGTAEERIAIDPCARHSHTNLRNAGRFLLTHGLRRALIVTSRDQAMYFGKPRSSSFDGRCLADFGYVVGDLRAVDGNRVAFIPSGRVMERGPDALDP